MRALRRRSDGQWRDAVQWRVRIAPPVTWRRAGEQKSELKFLDQQVSDAN
jgi:hypothetical protein